MSTSNTLGLKPVMPFNPAVLPLVSTTAGLIYAIVSTMIFRNFLGAAQTLPAETKRVQRQWWLHNMSSGLTLILVIGAANLVGGIYTLRSLPRQSLEWKVAVAGLVLAMSHFLYAKKVFNVINNICDKENEEKGETMNWIREWLRVHHLRFWTTDIPALACFAWLVFRA